MSPVIRWQNENTEDDNPAFESTIELYKKFHSSEKQLELVLKLLELLESSIAKHKISRDDIFENLSGLKQDDPVAHFYVTDAAYILFKRSPTKKRWKFIYRLSGLNLVDWRYLRECFKIDYKNKSAVWKKFLSLTESLIDDSITQPLKWSEVKDESLSQTILRWNSNRKISDMWFCQYERYEGGIFRDDYGSLDILFFFDPGSTCKLLEKYDNPYQLSRILRFSAFSPSWTFRHWETLYKYSKPAFTKSGNWNHKLLQIILLTTAASKIFEAANMIAIEEVIEPKPTSIIDAVLLKVVAKNKGNSTGFRWAVWLFRSLLSSLHAKGLSAPDKTDPRSLVVWHLLSGLIQKSDASIWLNLHPNDIPSDNQLCASVLRCLIAQQNEIIYSQCQQDIFNLLPASPEEFHMRNMTNENGLGVFDTFATAPDHFVYRILSVSLFSTQTDFSTIFTSLWRDTLILRELTEYRGRSVGIDEAFAHRSASSASKSIKFILYIGLGMIDILGTDKKGTYSKNRNKEISNLLDMVFDGARELRSLDVISRDHTDLQKHLVHRRVYFEEFIDEKIAPKISNMLLLDLDVSVRYFEFLSFLLVNGVPIDRIETELEKGDISFRDLIDEFRALKALNSKISLDMTIFE